MASYINITAKTAVSQVSLTSCPTPSGASSWGSLLWHQGGKGDMWDTEAGLCVNSGWIFLRPLSTCRSLASVWHIPGGAQWGLADSVDSWVVSWYWRLPSALVYQLLARARGWGGIQGVNKIFTEHLLCARPTCARSWGYISERYKPRPSPQGACILIMG